MPQQLRRTAAAGGSRAALHHYGYLALGHFELKLVGTQELCNVLGRDHLVRSVRCAAAQVDRFGELDVYSVVEVAEPVAGRTRHCQPCKGTRRRAGRKAARGWHERTSRIGCCGPTARTRHLGTAAVLGSPVVRPHQNVWSNCSVASNGRRPIRIPAVMSDAFWLRRSQCDTPAAR